jgi:hypothetical protein
MFPSIDEAITGDYQTPANYSRMEQRPCKLPLEVALVAHTLQQQFNEGQREEKQNVCSLSSSSSLEG